MVIGEHAVVYGYPAIVCAIDQRITVCARTRSDDLVSIESPVAPKFEGTMDDLPLDGPLRFVAAALNAQGRGVASGIDIDITSRIDPTLGLGSSAAVTIALLGAITALGNEKVELNDIHKRALKLVRDLQGRGSGADLAASLKGGCLSYQIATNEDETHAAMKPLPQPPSLSLCYAGYKTPTGEVLARVAEARCGQETHFDKLYAIMGACAERAITEMKAQDWNALALSLNEYQGFMRELGVSDTKIEHIVASAHKALAAKISGSGLGDCVLALGTVPTGFTKVRIAEKGLVLHDV